MLSVITLLSPTEVCYSAVPQSAQYPFSLSCFLFLWLGRKEEMDNGGKVSLASQVLQCGGYLGLQWNTHFSVSWEGLSLWWLDNPVAVGRGCALQQSLTTRRSAAGVWSTVQKGWRDLLEDQDDKHFEHLSLLQWYWRDLSRNIQLPVQLRFNPGEFTVFLSSL